MPVNKRFADDVTTAKTKNGKPSGSASPSPGGPSDSPSPSGSADAKAKAVENGLCA